MPGLERGDALRRGGRLYYNGVRGFVTARYCGVALVARLVVCPVSVSAQLPVPAATGYELLAGGTLDLRWISAEGVVVVAPPAVDAMTAYVPTKSGRVAAFDLDSGRVRWDAAADTAWAPAAGDGRVFLAVAGGVRALDAATGATVWERSLPAAAAAPPHWDNGWLVVSVAGGDLIALRAADGEPQWTSPLGAAIATAPVPAADALYLGLTDGRILALELTTGKTRWTRAFDGRATGLRALDEQLVVGTTARAVYSLDLENGRSRWRWRVGGPAIGRATADDRRIYFAAYDHLLRAVDRRSGNLRWRRALPHRPAGSPLVAGTLVLMPSLSPEISVYDAATGAPARAITSAGEVAGETVVRSGGSAAGTRILAISVEGRVLAFAPRVEPAPTKLEGLPGTPVIEPAPAQAVPPPAGPGSDRR